MRTRWRAGLLAATVATVAALAGLPAAGRAADVPDLKIEVDGLWDPNDDRMVLLRVSNVGTGPASAGKAHVQTLSPVAGNVAEPEYPALDPGKSFAFKYELDAPCNGHVIKAGVSATDDGEMNYDNNFVQAPCPEKPPPPPAPEEPVGPAPRRTVPEHKRPGSHTLPLEPSLARSKGAGAHVGNVACNITSYAPTTLAVGWRQVEVAQVVLGVEVKELCRGWHESQVGVEFDFGIFDDIPGVRVTAAVLRFRESELSWENGEGRRQGKPGCVAHVDVATDELFRPNVDDFPLRSKPYERLSLARAHRVDVTSAVEGRIERKQTFHGFVLRGTLSQLDLRGEDDSKCTSKVENLELEVQYNVP